MTVPLTPDACRRALDDALSSARAAGASGVEITIASARESLTRFANNGIHQNVSEFDRLLSVRAVAGPHTARASTNSLDPAAVRRAARDAASLALASAPDDSLCPLLTPAEAGSPSPVLRHDPPTAALSPAARAEAAAGAISIVSSAGHTAAGIFSTSESFEAILNSEGLEAFHSETLAVFSLTALAPDSSGWAKSSAVAASAIDPAALARRASDKARLSANPRQIPAGRYTVILEPAAVLDLIGQLAPAFSATAIADGRSFLNDRLGAALFASTLSISDDCAHPLQSGAPFDGEGMARRPLALVRSGTPLEIPYSRARARAEGKSPTGHGLPLPNETGESPANIVIAGGSTPIEDMIASTPRGVLVSRLWYIREVDPYETIFTGITRDGTFWIENGELAYGLKNFRVNVNLIELLNHIEALSPSLRASGEEMFDMVVPAMKLSGFPLSEPTVF